MSILNAIAAELNALAYERMRQEDTAVLVSRTAVAMRQYFRDVTNAFLAEIKDPWQEDFRESRSAEALEPFEWQIIVDSILEEKRPELESIIMRTLPAFPAGASAMISQTEGASALGISFDIFDQAAVDYLRGRDELAITQIDAGTRRIIDSIVSTAVENGDSYTTLAKRIRATAGFDNELYSEDINGNDRADRVAIFEVGDRYEEGNLQAAQQTAAQGLVVKKIWTNAGDSRVRPAHVSSQAEGAVDLEYVYSDGAIRPPTDPNCRCFLQFEIEDIS